MTVDAAMSGPVRRAPIPAQPIYDLTLGSPYRSAWRLAAFMILVALVSTVGGIALALKIRRLLNIIPMAYHRLCCWLLDIHIEVRGTMSTVRPTLFVCNHSSYLDISVLGSLITGSFIAKAEVADWPLFGYLAKLQRTVFVERGVAASCSAWKPEAVIWPAWCPTEVPDSTFDMASFTALDRQHAYWDRSADRIREAAKWMATVLGLALATLIGTSPFADLSAITLDTDNARPSFRAQAQLTDESSCSR